MTDDELQTLIEDATADFAIGETDNALAKLSRATATAPQSFEAWHALAEVNFSCASSTPRSPPLKRAMLYDRPIFLLTPRFPASGWSVAIRPALNISGRRPRLPTGKNN